MVGDLLMQSLRDPRAAAQQVMKLDLPVQARWVALALVAVLSVLLTQVGLVLFPLPASTPWEFWMQDAWVALPLQIVFLVMLTAGISLIGRRFGGHARLADALVLVAWLEFVMLVVQIAQLVAVLAAPVLGFGIGLASIALFFWLLTAFTAEANGFSSLPRVFFGIVGSMFLVAFVLVVLTVLLGLGPIATGG